MKSTKKRILTITLIIAIISVLIASVCAISYSVSNTGTTSSKEESTETELKIEFFPFGKYNNNYKVGDSFIITYGDVQILVDAGSQTNANDDLIAKMKAHMNKDKGKVWDYVIATHPDYDHISAFSTNENWFGITYREDLASAAEELKVRHLDGTYPSVLF